MRYLYLIFILLVFVTSIFAAEYTVPRAAYSVYSEDLNLDGDKDIIVGHKYNSQTDWGGVSILENNGSGEFELIDSLFFNNGFAYVNCNYIDNDNYIDIFGQYVSDDPAPINNRFIGIIYDFGNLGFNNINYFPLNTRAPVQDITSGDIDNDNDIDIIVASNNGQFWSILYNNGLGQFPEPEYHYVTGYSPSGIACCDLNNDGRDDIVICGLKLEVYLSYPNSFQNILVDDLFYMCDVKITDIDNDGYNDIVAVDWGIPGTPKRILIYSNDGNCNFNLSYTKWIDEAMAEIFISDLNNDNNPDIIYNVSYSSPNSEYERTHTYILFNNGDNTLADPINYQTYSGNYEYTTSIKSFSTDIDGNGLKDIVTVNYIYNGDNNINILFQDDVNNFVDEPQVGIDDEECVLISNNLILSNFPNPFNPTTTIKLSIPEESKVELTVYNIKGQKIKTLVSDQLTVGQHSVIWNGNDEYGDSVSSGIYLYKLNVNGGIETVKKCLLLK